MTIFKILVFSLLARSVIATQPAEFVILITSYNNEQFVEANLASVAFQESSKPYHIIYINDCSQDKTGALVDEFVRKHNLFERITVTHNKERVGALKNIYDAVHNLIEDHKVVVSVDGDDQLADNKVLRVLEKAYAGDIWMTYGTSLIMPDNKKLSSQVPRSIIEHCSFRKYKFVTQHLRTFKSALFKKIRKGDLMREGVFFATAWDNAFMFPMLEMCAPVGPGAMNHSAYIPKIVYIYNNRNPISDFRVHKPEQRELARYIRSLPPYKPLTDLTQ